jgi:hypothetical protein
VNDEIADDITDDIIEISEVPPVEASSDANSEAPKGPKSIKKIERKEAPLDEIPYQPLGDSLPSTVQSVPMLDSHLAELDKDRTFLTLEQIREGAEKIDAKIIAKEIMTWLTANVEDFIDNQETVYRVYLAIDASHDMPASLALQNLYVGIPEPKNADDEAGMETEVQMLDLLDSVCADVHEALTADKEGIDALFKRLIFFYEMTGYSREEGPLVQEMRGNVSFTDFAFDPIPMTMQVKQTVAEVQDGEAVVKMETVEGEDGETVEVEKKALVKEVFMPAGYGIEMELEMWKAPSAPSMY